MVANMRKIRTARNFREGRQAGAGGGMTGTAETMIKPVHGLDVPVLEPSDAQNEQSRRREKKGNNALAKDEGGSQKKHSG